MRFTPDSLFGKFWSKDCTDQPILSLLKILNKKQYGSPDIVFLQNFHQKIIQFNPYSFLKKFLPKDSTVQTMLSFNKISTKVQYGSTHKIFYKMLIKRWYSSIHIVPSESFYQKAIWFNPYCLFRKLWPKYNTV